MDFVVDSVHKLWIISGILMHSIHKLESDLGVYIISAVDYLIFRPIFRDLTTRFIHEFNTFHTVDRSYPQVMHRLWVNYTHVIS